MGKPSRDEKTLYFLLCMHIIMQARQKQTWLWNCK